MAEKEQQQRDDDDDEDAYDSGDDRTRAPNDSGGTVRTEEPTLPLPAAPPPAEPVATGPVDSATAATQKTPVATSQLPVPTPVRAGGDKLHCFLQQ